MRSARLVNTKGRDVDVFYHSEAGIKPGDVTWVKLRGFSWWPAQVVEESSISRTIKPRKKISSEVLVRLYGRYKYVYVDPIRSLLEFENILKQHNGNHKEIIRKSLEKELWKLTSGVSEIENLDADMKDNGASGTSKKNGKREGPNSVNDSLRKLQSGGGLGKGQNTRRLKLAEDASLKLTAEKSPEDLRARRFKVMQGLGLVAPPGSPF